MKSSQLNSIDYPIGSRVLITHLPWQDSIIEVTIQEYSPLGNYVKWSERWHRCGDYKVMEVLLPKVKEQMLYGK